MLKARRRHKRQHLHRCRRLDDPNLNSRALKVSLAVDVVDGVRCVIDAGYCKLKVSHSIINIIIKMSYA